MNVMIAGIEASGKTVLLSCLYGLYARPDDKGYFLNPKDPDTYSYLEQNLSILRNEQWPSATNLNDEKLLSLELRSEEGVLCDIPVRDFAGEVYVWAFGGIEQGDPTKVERLKNQIQDADILLAIVNLRDIVNDGVLTQDELIRNWTTKALFDYVAKDTSTKKKKLAIILSQCDFYQELITECGGPLQVVEKYLPSVAYVYKDIDVFAVSAIDKVEVNAEGVIVPCRNFSSESLRPLMNWIIQRVEEVKENKKKEILEAIKRQERLKQYEEETKQNLLIEEKKQKRKARFWRCSRFKYWFYLFLIGYLTELSLVFFELFNIVFIITIILWAWVSACRLRDCNCRGWPSLLIGGIFIPQLSYIIMIICLITSVVLGFIPGTKGLNRWGIRQ